MKKKPHLRQLAGAADPKDIWTKDELAQEFGVCKDTISRWVRNGSLPKPRRVSNRPYWLRSEVLAWIKASKSEGRAS